MRFIENEIYHIYNCGNNHQNIFFSNNNYTTFLKKVRTEWKPFCEILAWCLMPNHFHFMIYATEASCKEIPSYGGKPMQLLARKIGLSLSSYAQYINHEKGTSGSLFQQKTKAKCISLPDTNSRSILHKPSVNANTYITACMHYIHQNPMTARLVNKMEDWIYSSFADYAGLRNGTLCNKQLLFQLTGYEENNFYKDSYSILEEDILKKIIE